MSKAHIVGLALAAAQIGFYPASSSAQSPPPSGGGAEPENASLGPYCVGAAIPNAKPLAGLNHLHYGVENMGRYYRRDPKYPPKFWLQEAIGDFNYVIGHNPGSSNAQMADVYMHRAVALTLSGKDAAARQDYVNAIHLNPNLSRAYLGLARSYAQVGLRAEALETVTGGLRCLPASKLLQQEYVKYGGKLPYPEPVIRARNPESNTAGSEQLDQEPLPSEKGESDSKHAESAGSAASGMGDSGAASPGYQAGDGSGQGGEGVPDRGCRFCPPEEIQQRWREFFGQESNQ